MVKREINPAFGPNPIQNLWPSGYPDASRILKTHFNIMFLIAFMGKKQDNIEESICKSFNFNRRLLVLITDCTTLNSL